MSAPMPALADPGGTTEIAALLNHRGSRRQHELHVHALYDIADCSCFVIFIMQGSYFAPAVAFSIIKAGRMNWNNAPRLSSDATVS